MAENIKGAKNDGDPRYDEHERLSRVRRQGLSGHRVSPGCDIVCGYRGTAPARKQKGRNRKSYYPNQVLIWGVISIFQLKIARN
jgi:hypothetical protein